MTAAPAVLIALYYNEAWLAVGGQRAWDRVWTRSAKDYRYPLLYRTHRAATMISADVAGHLLGWQTTPQTKPLMEQTFGQALKEGTHGLRDPLTGREFTTYVEDPKNRRSTGRRRARTTTWRWRSWARTGWRRSSGRVSRARRAGARGEA
jgi:hypothetical protein